MKTRKRDTRKYTPVDSPAVKTRPARRAEKVNPIPQLRRKEPARKLWPFGLAFLLSLAAGFTVYGPAMEGAFVFDDFYLPFNIPYFPVDSLRAWVTGVRPILMFSYFANYKMSGLHTFWWHAFNVIFHAINSTLLFLIVRKVLELAGIERRKGWLLAGFAGALFLLHPLQTESVAYIASRSETLSVLFFFGAFAVFLYRRSAEISWRRTAAVLVLFGAAILTKEHTAVLVALLLLTDYFWNPGFSVAGIRRNWRLYSTLGLAAAAGVATVLKLIGADPSAGFAIKDFTWYQYFFTQCRAFWIYIRLFLFPVGQNVDYDVAISRTILDHGAVFGLVAILIAAAAAFYFRRRYPLAAYGFFAFVILMAPTSSFMPIKDPLVERRLYLSMIGLLFIIVDFLDRLKVRRKSLAWSLAAVLAIAAVLTYQRSYVFTGPVALWEDAVAGSPRKARPQFQLAVAYFQTGRCDKAVERYPTAQQLAPKDETLLIDWALAYDCLHQPDEALEKLKQAAALKRTAHVYSQMGMIYGKQGKRAEALQALDAAQKLDPNFEMTYVYRGNVRQQAGDVAGAVEQYRQALAVNPANQPARQALALLGIR